MLDIRFDQTTIDRLIRPILGLFDDSEDCYQEVQLRILERLAGSEKEIVSIAKEVKNEQAKDYLNRKYNLRSLHEPICNGNEKYTFESILAENKDEAVEISDIGPSAKLLLRFLVKEIVDGRSLSWAILSLLRTSPELLRRHHRRWEEWEDRVVREKYTRGGCLAVALFLNRTVKAIASRANSLGIRRYPGKHRTFDKDSGFQQKKCVECGRVKRQELRINDHHRLESRRVKEERLRAKEKRWLECVHATSL